MNVLAPQVAFWINQCFPLAGHSPVPVRVHDRNLDDSILSSRKQSSRLEVDYSETFCDHG